MKPQNKSDSGSIISPDNDSTKHTTEPSNSGYPEKKKSTKKLKIKNQQDAKIPKNVNDYRHIIDYIYTKASDFEWILELRNHKKINSIESNINPSPPPFYAEDLEKYKKRNNNETNKRYLKINLAEYHHIIDNPAGMPANSTIMKYETCLRNDEPKKNPPWKSLVFNNKRNLFDTYLPPILKHSQENLQFLGDKVSRPLEQINSEVMLDGKKTRQRKFSYSKDKTLRFPPEHFPSSKYNNHFKIKNINSIKHMLNYDNINATTLWGANLRDYGKGLSKTEGNQNIKNKK